MSTRRNTVASLAEQKLGIAVGVVATLGVVLGVSLVNRGDTNRGSMQTQTSYTLRPGDVVRDPATETTCASSSEGGQHNLFCTRTTRNRFQVVFYSDELLLFDLEKKNREPLAPDYTFNRITHPR